MNRRKILQGIGLLGGGTVVGASSVALYLNGGNNNQEDTEEEVNTVDPEELSTEVQDVRSLASDFTQEITQHYQGSVYITKNAQIVFDYQTKAQDDLESEFIRIAEVFVDVIRENEYEAVSLTLVVGGVQAVFSETPVEKYAAGELEKEGFVNTMQVNNIERRESN